MGEVCTHAEAYPSDGDIGGEEVGYNRGMRAQEAAQDVTVEKYGSWLNLERLPLLVERLYMEFRGELE